MLRQDFQSPEHAGNTYIGSDAGVPTQAIGTIPQFYMDTEIDGHASRKAGRIIHKNVEMVLILFAGSNNQSIRRKVLPHDQQVYAQQYAAFKKGSTKQVDGTALTEWPAIDRATAESLKIANIFSVEQLANLSDGDLMNLGMGADKWRQKAIDWLNISQGNADQMAMQEKLRDMQDQLEQMRAENAKLHMANENHRRVNEIAAATKGGANPVELGLPAPVDPDAGADPEMDRMLLQANGLDPNLAPAQAAAQQASDERLGTFDDASELPPLELNTEPLEVE